MKNLIVFFCLLCFLSCGTIVLAQASKTATPHETTRWDVSSSFALDAICFLNVLTGDEFYVERYKDDYARFEPKLTPAARRALANLKRKIKDEKKTIVSAFLVLPFSTIEARNLDDLIKHARDSRQMRANYQKTPYYSDEGWQLFESISADLQIVFKFLKRIKFEKYYRQNVLPHVNNKIPAVKAELQKYNVVAEVEKLLHFSLTTNVITVNLLNFSKPHGIRVTGIRFLTHVDYPFKIVLQTAIHELMHPPYDLKSDEELRKTLDSLRTDAFLMDKVTNHNPSFGYNTFEGFIEENCVKALDQLISEKFGMGSDAREKWRTVDDGIHVFAPALYSLIKAERFDGAKESLRDFLVRQINSGKLAPGQIKSLYDTFYKQ